MVRSPPIKHIIDDLTEAGIFPLDYIVQLNILHEGIPHTRLGMGDGAEIAQLLLFLRFFEILEEILKVSCALNGAHTQTAAESKSADLQLPESSAAGS